MIPALFPLPGPVQAVDPLPVGSATNKWRTAYPPLVLPPSFVFARQPIFPVALPGDGSQGSARTSHNKNKKHKRTVAVDFGGATGLTSSDILILAVAGVLIAKYWFKA